MTKTGHQTTTFQRSRSCWGAIFLVLIGPLSTIPVAADDPVAPKAQPLNDRSLDNVVALTKLFGYVRYFYPSNEARSTDWDAFAIRSVQAAEAARTDAELADALEATFQPIAPLIRIYAGKAAPSDDDVQYSPGKDAKALQVTAWRHEGVGISDNPIYKSVRVTKDALDPSVPGSFLDPDYVFRANLCRNVNVAMPCALYVDDRSTLPGGSVTFPKRSHPPPDGAIPRDRNRDERLAAVAIAWNVLQHFYPYFEEVDVDWPAELRIALRSAATDPDKHAFLCTLQIMIAALQDGHGNVTVIGAPRRHALPLFWAWIEDQLVITAILPNARLELAPGDVVTHVNGRPALEMIQAEEQLISAATPWLRRHRAVRALRLGRKYTGKEIKVRGADGETHTFGLMHTVEQGAVVEQRPAPIAEVAPGVLYYDLGRVTYDEGPAALPRLLQAKGIIFDLRGYRGARSPYDIPISHLIDEPVDSSRWLTPIVSRPDRSDMQFEESHWTIQPRAPRFQAKVVYITNTIAVSAAETHMAIIENYQIAPIVGGPTAGTNGNVNPFELPGGCRVSWTGLRVLKHDGSCFHGVGVHPTIPCNRTIEGVRAGRDELLERAIKVVQSP